MLLTYTVHRLTGADTRREDSRLSVTPLARLKLRISQR
jgi:hypothetical protein